MRWIWPAKSALADSQVQIAGEKQGYKFAQNSLACQSARHRPWGELFTFHRLYFIVMTVESHDTTGIDLR